MQFRGEFHFNLTTQPTSQKFSGTVQGGRQRVYRVAIRFSEGCAENIGMTQIGGTTYFTQSYDLVLQGGVTKIFSRQYLDHGLANEFACA